MKIVYFNYLYDLYGVSIGSTIKGLELMRNLEGFGHEVKIYWRKPQPAASNNAAPQSGFRAKDWIKSHIRDPKHFLLHNVKYLAEEYRILKAEQPNVLISRLDLYLFSALALAKWLKIPLVVEADAPCVYETRHFHPHFTRVGKIGEYIEKANLVKADAVFCVSNRAREYFLQYGISEEKLHVISNGVDVDKFRPSLDAGQVRRKYQLEGKIVVGFIGSFHYWHGVDNLIAMIQHVLESHAASTFLLVGSGGPMKSEIEKFIERDHLHDRIHLTGHVDYRKVPNYISAMDIVLAPYPALDFFYFSPVKVYEYMACGKPVVTSRIGQLSEIIEHGENGLLCEPGNMHELLENILSLIQNESLRRKIGEQARETVVQHHTWKHKAAALHDICLRVRRPRDADIPAGETPADRKARLHEEAA